MSEGGPSSKILRHQNRDAVPLTSLAPAAPGLVHPLDARLAQAEAENAGLRQNIQRREQTRLGHVAHICQLQAQLREADIQPVASPPIQPDGTAVGLEVLGLPKGWQIGSLENGNKLVSIAGFLAGHELYVSEDRIEDASEFVIPGEDLEDWLKCKLAFHRRVEAESQGKRIPAPDIRSESERVRPSEDLDDELTEIDVEAILEVLEGSPTEVVARALENRTSTEGRALAAAYARKRRGEKCLGVQNVAPDPPFTAPPPRSPGGSACAPSDNGNVHRGGGRGLRATVPAWITHPQISPSSSGETRRGDSGAFARQSKEDRREERDE
jgi:hypothetical protein